MSLRKSRMGIILLLFPLVLEHPFCRNHGQRALFYNNSCRKLCNAFSFYNSFCRVMRRDQLYKLFIYKFFWHSGFSLHDFHLAFLNIIFKCCRKELPPNGFYKISCRTTCLLSFFYNNSCRNVLPDGPFYNLFFSRANAIVI